MFLVTLIRSYWNVYANVNDFKGVDTGGEGGALGAEAPPDFQALQYIQYTCMETNVEF